MTAVTVRTEHGEYSYSVMPSNRALAMCYRFKVFQKYQGRGYGHNLKAHQMRTLADAGVRFAVCSTRADNLRMIRILEKAGWARASYEFVSPHTGHLTQVWQCHIEHRESADIGAIAAAFGIDPSRLEK